MYPQNSLRWWSAPILALLLLVPMVPGFGQPIDSDRDGMSDAAEVALGTDPKTAETFSTIVTRKPSEKVADKSRFVTEVALANAGGDRFVWRVQFAEPWPIENSNILLYVDSDNDAKTGRAGHGCEAMLRVTRGEGAITAYAPDGQVVSGPMPRAFVDGRFVYISHDMALKQEDGRSLFRLMVLSETWEPHEGVDSIRYFSARGPAMSDRPKLKLDSDLTESLGMEQTYGPRTVDPLLNAKENVRLPIFQCETQGFRFVPSEYRADNVLRSGAPARITAKVPRAGTFYPGFVIHDEAGREVVGLFVNGERQGVAVASVDDNDQRLFFLSRPVSLKQGDTIELRPLSSEGPYRIEDLVLLAKKPAAKPLRYEIRHLEAGENRITWITTWPAACVVELENGQRIKEPTAVNNHRVYVPEMKLGQTIRYRITTVTREGKPIATPWRRHTWRPVAEPATKRAGSVPLRVEAPAGATLKAWPVTSGVPFPQGALGSADHLALADAAGKSVPLQATVTARWPDGSVKWVLLDFRHSGASATYQLRYGPRVRRDPLPQASVRPPALGALTLVDSAGKRFTMDLAATRVEEQGALRACFYGSGQLKDGEVSRLAYVVRAHSYPGTPWVRVLFTYVNDFPESEFQTLRSLKWDVPVKAAQSGFVHQHTDDRYVASTGEGKRWSAPLGALFVRDFWQNYPLDLEVGPQGAAFWLLPPLKADEYDWAKGSMDEHRLFYWFQALENAGGYKLRQGVSKTHEVWIGLDGAAPQHDRPLMAACPPSWYANSKVFGDFAIADAKREVVKEYDAKVAATLEGYLQNRERNREYGALNFGDWWGERVINWGNIEYDTQHAFFLQFARSGDFRFFQAGEEAERHNRDVDTVHAHANDYRVGAVYSHCMGHVGDYYAKSPLPGPHQGSPRGGFSVSHTWCEGHCDHYFLTGDRRSLETARKIADRYGVYGTTNFDFTNCRVPGWHLILTMGVYRATGDPFYLNAARIIVERVLERQTEEAALGSAGGGWRRRMVPGHCLCEPAHYGNAGFMVGVLLTGLRWYHQETNDPRVARSIHLGARYLIKDLWMPAVNGFRYTTCPRSSSGPWSNLLLFDGIGYAYQLTGDQELAQVLMAGTDAAIKSMSGMGKSFTMYIRVAPHVLDLLAKLREDPVLPLTQLNVETPAPLSGSTTVKFDASGTRWPKGGTGRLTWDFGDGATAVGEKVEHTYARGGKYRVILTAEGGGGKATAEAMINLPPKELEAVARGRATVVEAEGFSGQGGGNVRIVPDRVAASGPIITGWHMEIGHWLEWKATVPEAGRYRLLLKYCSDSPNPRRELRVDGQIPADSCKEIAFPRTGGFSVGKDDWAYLTVGGEEKPLLLDLTAGEHTIRMTNLGDGLALDWLALIREK